jgi:hypothetical protein
MNPRPAVMRSVFIDGGLCEVAGSILRGIAYPQVLCVFKPMRVWKDNSERPYSLIIALNTCNCGRKWVADHKVCI